MSRLRSTPRITDLVDRLDDIARRGRVVKPPARRAPRTPDTPMLRERYLNVGIEARCTRCQRTRWPSRIDHDPDTFICDHCPLAGLSETLGLDLTRGTGDLLHLRAPYALRLVEFCRLNHFRWHAASRTWSFPASALDLVVDVVPVIYAQDSALIAPSSE